MLDIRVQHLSNMSNIVGRLSNICPTFVQHLSPQKSDVGHRSRPTSLFPLRRRLHDEISLGGFILSNDSPVFQFEDGIASFLSACVPYSANGYIARAHAVSAIKTADFSEHLPQELFPLFCLGRCVVDAKQKPFRLTKEPESEDGGTFPAVRG